MESVFAEYQKELLETYDIFALEGTYETGSFDEEKVMNRLEFYGAGNMKHRVRKIRFLTDNGGQEFCSQVEAYMQHKYGLDMFADKLGASTVWKQQKEKGEELKQQEAENEKLLEGMLAEKETSFPQEDNPIAHGSLLKSTPLLTLVLPKDKQVPQKKVSGETLLSKRARRQGYGDFSPMDANSIGLSGILLGEYLLEHFPAFTDEKRTGPLDCQLEYILAGGDSDEENLEAVGRKLMLVRFVPNYLYLQSDGEKKAQAQAMAATLCTAAAIPIASGAAAQAILLAWAFGETVLDVRSLLSGNRVALSKTSESWQLQLSSLLKLGTQEDQEPGRDHPQGLDYKEYLRMLFFLESREELAMRSLDLIELTLQKEKGLSFFLADQCISRLEITTDSPLRRGITYQFATSFGYN